MRQFDIEIPEEVRKRLEYGKEKPGSWVSPEIDRILLEYGAKKTMKAISQVILEVYGKRVPPRRLQFRYQQLLEREGP